LRIVSLLPGATEIACALGLADDLVGISHECDFPPEISGKPRLTRSLVETSSLSSGQISSEIAARRRSGEAVYDLDASRLRALRPDLVLTQSVCGVCAVPAETARAAVADLRPCPEVLSLEGSTLEEVLDDVEAVGEATGRDREARRLVEDLRTRVQHAAPPRPPGSARARVVCLEWLDPPMAAGHWIPDLVERAGGVDLLGRSGEPSFVVPWEHVAAADPEHLVLIPCGFEASRTTSEMDTLRARPGWDELRAVRAGRVHVLDANAAFSRPGPRLVEGVEALAARLRS